MMDLVDQICAAAISWLMGAYLAVRGLFFGGSASMLGICLTLFIILYGYAVLTGRIEVSGKEVFSRLGIIIVVYLGVTNVGYFNSILRVFFLNTNIDIANGILGAGSTSTGDVRVGLETCFDKAFGAADAIWENAGWDDILLNILGLLIALAVLLFVGGAAFMITLSTAGTCILLALTPLMFLSLLFPVTRSIFERWLGLLFNFWFIPILTYLVLSFVTDTAADVADSVVVAVQGDAASDAALTAIAKFLFVTVIGTLLLWQVMTMASSLGGGVALSTMGAGSALAGWLGNKFSPPSKRYTSGGPGFEGRTRTTSGDLRRIGRTFGYRRDRDGNKSPS